MRVIMQLLIGGMIGFVLMYTALSADFKGGFPDIAFEVSIVLNSITLLLVLLTVASTLQINQRSKQRLDGAEEDEHDIWLYKRLSDMNLVITVALVTAIAASAVSIITEQAIWVTVVSLSAFIVSAALSMLLPALMSKQYPERNLPSVSEKDYAKKLLAASDEGEKFVMLQALYKTFTTLNSALLIVLMLLIVYSASTGDSQLFSIFIVGILLIGTNAQYLLSIRNKS